MPFCFIFFPHQGQWWQHLFLCYFSGAFHAVIVKGLSAFPLHTHTHTRTYFLREGTAQIHLQEKEKKKKKEFIWVENGMRDLEESIYTFDFMVLFKIKKWRSKRFQVTYFEFFNGK